MNKILSAIMCMCLANVASAQANTSNLLNGVQFSPMIGEFKNKKTFDFTFVNHSNEVIVAKQKVMKWNADGSLQETKDIGIAREIIEMEPKKEYVLRLFSKTNKEDIQKTYRLQVEVIKKSSIDVGIKRGDLLSFPILIDPIEKDIKPVKYKKESIVVDGKKVNGVVIENQSNIIHKANHYVENGKKVNALIYIFPRSEYFIGKDVEEVGENLVK